MAFKASPSSQHQHCTDEAQKAETVLSAVIYIYIYIYRQNFGIGKDNVKHNNLITMHDCPRILDLHAET